MKLKNFTIRNFRSIDEMSFELCDFTSLIGPNNCGKSSILKAIDMFLKMTKPSLDDWRKGHENEPIIFEGIFDDIQEWERDKPGVSSLVFDNKIQLKVETTRTESSIEQSESVFRSPEVITGWNET